MPTNTSSILALDIGERRVGVAVANLESLIASPLVTLENNEHLLEELTKLVSLQNTDRLVIGLPRGLEGQETAQTRYIIDLSNQIEKSINLPIYFQDEALTSVKAKEELDQRGKVYAKSEVDFF